MFENQVQHASLTRTIADVQLTYYFDWHDGLRWHDVLKGKTAQPAAGTGGATVSGIGEVSNSASTTTTINPGLSTNVVK